jgi:hypothetical protein
MYANVSFTNVIEAEVERKINGDDILVIVVLELVIVIGVVGAIVTID